MYEELVKRLRNCATEAAPCKTCGMIDDGFCTDTLLKQAADAIEELTALSRRQEAELVELTGELASKPCWIPVTEQPQFKVGDDGYNGYLVYANGYYEIADYTMNKLDGVPYFHVDGEYEAYVTHFMPLPKPPKEVRNCDS